TRARRSVECRAVGVFVPHSPAGGVVSANRQPRSRLDTRHFPSRPREVEMLEPDASAKQCHPEGDTTSTLFFLYPAEATVTTSTGTPTSARPTVTAGGRTSPYRTRWQGERMLPSDGYLVLVIRTGMADPTREVPRLLFVVASAGEGDTCVVHLDDLGRFVL